MITFNVFVSEIGRGITRQKKNVFQYLRFNKKFHTEQYLNKQIGVSGNSYKWYQPQLRISINIFIYDQIALINDPNYKHRESVGIVTYPKLVLVSESATSLERLQL